jgi:hypothetical protein
LQKESAENEAAEDDESSSSSSDSDDDTEISQIGLPRQHAAKELPDGVIDDSSDDSSESDGNGGKKKRKRRRRSGSNSKIGNRGKFNEELMKSITAAWEEGDLVDVCCDENGKTNYYSATIVEIHEEEDEEKNFYDVEYEDGEIHYGVKEDAIFEHGDAY